MYVRIVQRLVSGGLCLAVGCHPEPRSTFLEEPAGSERPLPPASGTPIGFLLDDSARLALRAEQVERLHEIDQRLATRNEQLDEELRALDRPPEPAARESGGAPGAGGIGGPPGADDLTWSGDGGSGADAALAVWQADPTAFDAMTGALGSCVAARNTRVVCEIADPTVANRHELVVELRGLRWLATSFVPLADVAR
jgi:hypothetical protein